MEGAGLPDRGVLSCLNQRSPGAAVGGARCTEDDVGRMTTSVANQLQSAPLAEGESKTVVTKTPWWEGHPSVKVPGTLNPCNNQNGFSDMHVVDHVKERRLL